MIDTEMGCRDPIEWNAEFGMELLPNGLRWRENHLAGAYGMPEYRAVRKDLAFLDLVRSPGQLNEALAAVPKRLPVLWAKLAVFYTGDPAPPRVYRFWEHPDYGTIFSHCCIHDSIGPGWTSRPVNFLYNWWFSMTVTGDAAPTFQEYDQLETTQ